MLHEYAHRLGKSVQRRKQSLVVEMLAGLGGETCVDFRGFAMRNRIADDCVTIGLHQPPPRISASSASSRVNLKRVIISHTSSLPLVRILVGKRPNGAARRTMRSAALSSACLPELRSTRGPPSFS